MKHTDTIREALNYAWSYVESHHRQMLGDDNEHAAAQSKADLDRIDRALAILKAMEEQAQGWYCCHCERGVDSSEVTFHEQHEACGRVITNDKPPKHPAPSAAVELSEQDIVRIAREVFPPDTTNDGEPWYTDRQSTLNIGAKEAFRHITKHYTLYPKQP